MLLGANTAVLVFLTLLLTVAFAIDSDLVGVKPGSDPSAVKWKASDDNSYVDGNEFMNEMLTTHNKWRQEHGSRNVTWDTGLASFASGITKQCIFQHSGGPHGENLFAGADKAYKTIDGFGSERNLYKVDSDWDKPDPPKGTGHFTQLVWAETGRIGCARTKCSGVISPEFESWFVACNYEKRGNVGGAYQKNVFRRGTPVRG